MFCKPGKVLLTEDTKPLGLPEGGGGGGKVTCGVDCRFVLLIELKFGAIEAGNVELWAVAASWSGVCPCWAATISFICNPSGILWVS